MVIVSVVVPILNEEVYIENFLASLEQQDYAKENMEVLLIDGKSNDKTLEIIENYLPKTTFTIRVFENEKKIQATAMNIGIKESVGKYIIRLDVHAMYEKNYISECVKLLDSSDAQNVGFYIETKGRGKTGKKIAKVLSSRFGVGGSTFRVESDVEKEVDTVPFGAFRKSVFAEIGGFNEYLACNEDNDINYRIRKNGGKILISNSSSSTYFCRDTIGKLFKMGIRNGKWNVYSLYYSAGSMSIKYFIPAVFTLGLITLPILSLFSKFFLALLALELILYFLAASYFSYKLKDNMTEFIQLLAIFFVFHFSYGLGSVLGIFGYIKRIIAKTPKFKD